MPVHSHRLGPANRGRVRTQGSVLGLALWLGAAGSVGCSAAGSGAGEPQAVDLFISLDPTARTPLVEDWVSHAQDELREAFGFEVALVPQGGVPILLVSTEEHDPAWYGGYHGGQIGLDVWTLLTRACSPSGVLSHELLHALGYGHVKAEQGGSRMQPYISGCEPLVWEDLSN